MLTGTLLTSVYWKPIHTERHTPYHPISTEGLYTRSPEMHEGQSTQPLLSHRKAVGSGSLNQILQANGFPETLAKKALTAHRQPLYEPSEPRSQGHPNPSSPRYTSRMTLQLTLKATQEEAGKECLA